MEKNNITHNVKTYISFDGPHQGANLSIGLQNFVEYISKRGILSKISSTKSLIREGLYNGLAARQMLAHHTSANAQFPTPDALRTKFLQNLTAVGEYPKLCRKVAIIDGSNTGVINPKHPVAGDLMFDIFMKRRRFFLSCNNNICKAFDWSFSGAPNYGTARVSDMWTAAPLLNLLIAAPLGRTSTYGQAAWSNSSLDNAPGSLFVPLLGTSTNDQRDKQSDLHFWLQEINYLLTGSKKSGFTYNADEFTFMPSYHAADLNFPTKNLYLKWSDQYLCGKTPFDYVYAESVSHYHVDITPYIAQAFENEVRYNAGDLPQLSSPITGPDQFCTPPSTYNISFCKTANATVSWSITPGGIVTPTSGIGNSITLTRVSNGIITVNAAINYPNGGTTLNLAKSVIVGAPPPATITSVLLGPCPQTTQMDVSFTLASTANISSYQFLVDGNLVKSGSGYPISPVTVNGGSSGQHSVVLKLTNTCSSSNSNSYSYYRTCSSFTASPNPANNTVVIMDKEKSQSNRNSNTSSEKVHILIFDQSHRVVQQNIFTQNQSYTLHIEILKPGYYTVQIEGKVKRGATNFIKK